VGVPRPELAPFMARCLARLGVRRAWVVHGDGLDELSPCGPTTVASVTDGVVETAVVVPEQAGLPRCDLHALRGGDAAACAGITKDVLGGARGPRRDVVVFNAAAALVVAGVAADLRAGAALAAAAIDDGRALRVLERVREQAAR
jgi:anthranilate phosphoribosyltransferase